ncbi:ATP-binding cassette transporter [Jackrogersella minutella]|nr:ATP-binding cassette transporter [Jackrogersella minutella]
MLDQRDVTSDSNEIRELVRSFLRNRPGSERQRQDVVFQNPTVRGAGIGHQRAPTVPTALVSVARSLNPALYLSNKPQPSRTLLYPMSGILRGGETLMVIGKPGSGCTTFLKPLANMREDYEAVDGDILYNGRNATEMKSRCPGETAYASEDDIHFHSLSVGTTLRFALNARTLVNLSDRPRQLNKDVQTLLNLFDLAHVADVPVGNDHLRGVSGGQRHRVTLAEAFCTRASVMSFDNPTRGLDSSTALRVSRMLREYTIQTQCCTIMSLYQASDEISTCCDEVFVLNGGRVAFFGPTNESKQYFEDLGFQCSPQMSLTDFLTSISGDPKSRHVRADHSGPPSSKYYTGERTEASGQESPSSRSISNRSTWVAEAAGTIAQALMLGTIYRDQQAVTQGIYTRSSALFFCVLIMCLQTTAEFANTFAQRPILLKQRALCLYRPGAYALGQIFADIPWKAGAFFVWFLTLYVALMSLGVMFRSIAVFTTTPTRAVLPVGILLNALIDHTGYYINPPGMTPMYYALESVTLNEFTSSEYQCSTQDISSVPGNLLLSGQKYLESVHGFFPSNLWRNIGINAALFGSFALCRFKTPSGRLSTIFYSKDVLRTTGPKYVSPVPDEEKFPGQDTDISELALQEAHTTTNRTIRSSKQRFAWKDLCLDIQVEGEHSRLLSNVSGWLEPGTMTALIRMSRAGKTTLLDSLSQRGSIGVVTGGLYLGYDPLPQSMNRRSGFVQQQDVHLNTSTVREALQLTARLRQPASIPVAEKYENPDILLFLDEPTSGLDGDSAFSIITLMRKLADAGQTILCTIHQPSFELIEKFDNLLLLIPENPADYVLGLTAITSIDWASTWLQSPECSTARQRLDEMQLIIWMSLSNGLTFLQLPNKMADSRNRLFSIFIAIITGPVLTIQIEPRFIVFRDQCLARENESHVYHWSVFVLSAFLVEIPFALVGGLLYWLLWYYMTGYFYSSEPAQIATGFVWLMVNTFNGPLSPPPLTPTGWRWFYNVSLLFYFVEGVTTNVMHGLNIGCSNSEISVFRTPENQTCGEYAASFFDSSSSQGYLLDENALGDCAY